MTNNNNYYRQALALLSLNMKVTAYASEKADHNRSGPSIQTRG